MRWAGRARLSRTRATMTGVAAVAAIVPAPQKCETTSAATTAEAEAMTSVGRSRPPPPEDGGGVGGAGWRRVRVSRDVDIRGGREDERRRRARGLTTRSKLAAAP